MSVLDEARRHRYDRPEMIPHTAGAEDPEETSPEMLRGMIDKVLGVGYERRLQLDDMCKARESALEHLRDGTYYIRYAHVGQYADFSDRANHEYLKGKYPWLQSVSEGLGFDEDNHGDYDSFEAYLASIPHEEWNEWIEDMESLADYPLLDEDRASELEMEEAGRWMDEDGAPDLIKTMVEEADDSYEAFLLSKVTPELVWEWSRETDHYPENQGQGDVWMDMEKLGKDTETQEWFLEHLDDDVAGWLAEKRKAYDDKAGAMFDRMLHAMANEDEQVATVYNRLDAEGMWQLFLQTFPDERREQDDPYWYWWKPQYNEPGTWRVGYKSENHNMRDWQPGLTEALEDLRGKEWFWKLAKNWFSRGPEGHPEFKFEALERQPDPDDPEVFMRYGGGLQEEVVYEDDKIRVLYPRDYQTLNYHLLNAGLPQINEQNWRDLFKYKDVFIIQGKQPADLLGREDVRELAVVYGDSDVDLRVWTGSIKSPTIQEVIANPEYGRSIRRMLLRYYRERLQSDTKAGHVLLQLGGGREIRRAERRGHLARSDLGVALGLYYVDRHKYRLAAKAFNRSPNTIAAKGVWLIYDSVEDLTPVFKNEEAATTVFAHDHYDWFDHYYEKGNRPAVKDVIPFLSKDAIDHIRSVMVNRRVWFPDGGPDERGEYVVLTPKVLAEYDDATILDWIANPSDEDEEEGVFDDIIEEVQLAGVDILQSASQDSVYTGWVKAAVDAIGGKEHKWTNHPTKKYKTGEPMEAFKVFVPWAAVKDWDSAYYNEHGYHYDGDLESLAIDANADTADPDASNYEAGWHDVNKEWAAENLQRIFDLKPPEPIPGSPEYTDPDQLELPIKEAFDPDDPEAMPGAVEGFPPDFRRRVEAIIHDAYGYDVGPIEITVIPYFPPSDEEIDASDGKLHRMRNHQTVAIVYDPGQEVYSADSEAFQKIRGTVINTFRWLDVRDAYAAGPNPDEGDSPTKVQFWFTMYEKPQPVPAPPADDEGEDVPF